MKRAERLEQENAQLRQEVQEALQRVSQLAKKKAAPEGAPAPSPAEIEKQVGHSASLMFAQDEGESQEGWLFVDHTRVLVVPPVQAEDIAKRMYDEQKSLLCQEYQRRLDAAAQRSACMVLRLVPGCLE